MQLVVGLSLALLSIFVKILLFPSYHSTDFEVHRNWLAITNNLPIKLWYFDATSEWTLDYPPFFAYFEYFLSIVAEFLHPPMTEIANLNYSSQETVYIQRGSVIITDLLLFMAIWRFAHSAGFHVRQSIIVFGLIAFNAGLLMVDHIHFQYNGMLLGLLILSLDFVNRRSYLLTAVCFSILVLMKHLFVSLAPVFAVFLLRVYCFDAKGNFHVTRFLGLVTIAISALALAFGPFLIQDNGVEQIHQIFQRLFPFGRGLVHAYWAPNIWAIYCFVDKFCSFISIKILGIAVSSAKGVASTSGIVGDFGLLILPQVSAGVAMLLVFATQAPALIMVYRNPTPRQLLLGVVYCSMCSFMVGYHVHEKAVLIPQVVLSLIAATDARAGVLFLQLTAAGIFGLFPLFTLLPELVSKTALYATYLCGAWSMVNNAVKIDSLPSYYGNSTWFIFMIFFLLFLFTEVLHPLIFVNKDGSVKLPFLPLMATSVVTAVVLVWCWGCSLVLVLVGNNKELSWHSFQLPRLSYPRTLQSLGLSGVLSGSSTIVAVVAAVVAVVAAYSSSGGLSGSGSGSGSSS